MKSRKIISLALVCLMLATLLPTVALAAGGTGKAIRLVDHSGTTPEAENIEGAQGSSVYFGTYRQSKTGDTYNEDPIKWRVLQNADGKLFLLADQNLDVMRYHNDYESVTWEKAPCAPG